MKNPHETIEDLQKEVAFYKKQLNALSGGVISGDYKLVQMGNEIRQMKRGFAMIAALNQFKPLPVFEEIYDHFTEEINIQMQMDLSLVLQPVEEIQGCFTPTFIKGSSLIPSSFIEEQRIHVPDDFAQQKNSLLVNRQTILTPFIELLIKCTGIRYFILTPVVVQEQVIAYLFAGRKIETQLLAAATLLMHDVHTLEAIAGVIAALKNQEDRFQLLEKERTRISSDMHDEIGSGITHIALLSELMQTQQKGEAVFKKDINTIAVSARKLVQTMSEIIWALNPQNDTMGNLLAYTREQSQLYFESMEVKFEIDFPDIVPEVKLTNAQRRNLYLVTREALNNAMKHSEANVIKLTLTISGREYCFKVQDDGKGINQKSNKPGNNGLVNMKKRMEDINGTIDWPVCEKGTLVSYCLIV